MALNVSELSTMDATGQAELVRRSELTPLELVDAAIARIESVNPSINAVITPLFDEARAAAISGALPTGPFRGVPFLLKDAGAMQKGQPYYMGNRALRDAAYRSPSDNILGRGFAPPGLLPSARPTSRSLARNARRSRWPSVQPEIRGTWSDRLAALRVVLARQWPPVWCRSRMRMTRAARSGCPRDGADWSD